MTYENKAVEPCEKIRVCQLKVNVLNGLLKLKRK